MIFYLNLTTDKQSLTHAPHIDSICINLDGKSICCTWDETDAEMHYKNNSDDSVFKGKGIIAYRFKGVYFVDKYANGALTKDSLINIEKINWQENDNLEKFEYDIFSFTILDNNNKWFTPILKV